MSAHFTDRDLILSVCFGYALLQFGQNTGFDFKFNLKHFSLCIMAVTDVKKKPDILKFTSRISCH